MGSKFRFSFVTSGEETPKEAFPKEGKVASTSASADLQSLAIVVLDG